MEPPSPYRILILNDSGRRLRTERLKNAVRQALEDLGFEPGELSVRLTTDEALRGLNRDYRSKDEVTDVLTFPADPFPTKGKRPIGDIAIAMGQAERQAVARSIELETEVAYLALHGVLHLKGLDDESDEEREIMLREMDRLGTQAGLRKVTNWHTMPAGSSS